MSFVSFCYLWTEYPTREATEQSSNRATGNNTSVQFLFIWFSRPILSAWLIKKKTTTTREHFILWEEMTFSEFWLHWQDFQPPISSLIPLYFDLWTLGKTYIPSAASAYKTWGRTHAGTTNGCKRGFSSRGHSLLHCVELLWDCSGLGF